VNGPVVRLRVEDNGPGIDDQTRRPDAIAESIRPGMCD
jgi:hypothetical protein